MRQAGRARRLRWVRAIYTPGPIFLSSFLARPWMFECECVDR